MRWLVNPDAPLLAILIAAPLIYYWRVTVGAGVWFTTDIARLFYPYAVEMTRAMHQGRLPLWSPGMLAGMPLLAEGQVGALYPLNGLLYLLLPTATAISLGMLLHIIWAGCGMYAWTRAQGLRPSAAFLAGFVVSCNGTILGQLTHPPVLATMAWLPWLLFFHNRFASTRAWLWFGLTVLAMAMQLLCGSIQMAFINTLAFGAIVLASAWFEPRDKSLRRFVLALLQVSAIVLLGAGIAAAQFVPTLELVNLSSRGGGTSVNFATSYSLPPDFLTQFIFPFASGEPTEPTIEFWGYWGVTPLVLALLAIKLRRERRTIFYILFALVACSFALGSANPIYSFLANNPPFNFFRAPARFLWLMVLAGAFLAALVLDRLAQKESHPIVRLSTLAGTLIGVVGLSAQIPSEAWLTVWQLMPIGIGLALLVVCFLARRESMRSWLVNGLIVLTMIDLISYVPPFLATIDLLTPLAQVNTTPRSLEALSPQSNLGRVLTDESIFPSLPAMRASLFPNTALIYDWQSAQGFSSLAFRTHQDFLWQLSPAMLDLLNVRYVMIPLEPRPPTKPSTPTANYALDVLTQQVSIPPTRGITLELDSYTESTTQIEQGALIGELDVRAQDGRVLTLPIRFGIETSNWDDERQARSATRVASAHSFPAYWRSFGRFFQGQVYQARWSIPSIDIVSIQARVIDPRARLAVEEIKIIDDQGNARLVSQLAGKTSNTLAFLSDTVAVWENHNVLPRAFIAHAAEIANDDQALTRLRENNFPSADLVLVSEGRAIAPGSTQPPNDQVEITRYEAERVDLNVQSDQPGYLVLTDSWYPGWTATIDGSPASILRADVLFRAIQIEPGKHQVTFEYRPMAFVIGAAISIISVLTLVAVAFLLYRMETLKRS